MYRHTFNFRFTTESPCEDRFDISRDLIRGDLISLAAQLTEEELGDHLEHVESQDVGNDDPIVPDSVAAAGETFMQNYRTAVNAYRDNGALGSLTRAEFERKDWPNQDLLIACATGQIHLSKALYLAMERATR